MDCREFARLRRSIYESIDEQKLRATAWLDLGDEDGETLVTVRLRYEVCGTCDGRGRHVNPAIDSHGLSADDFAADPDFADDYRSGCYDIDCGECHGNRVVPTIDRDNNPEDVIAAIDAAERAARQYAAERYAEMRMGY